MTEWICLAFVFALGAVVGSFLNKCIERLPFEKSLFWPGSRCRNCLQSIGWLDSIPLLSYWLRRGCCRTCGKPFSLRFFAIELLTALGFAGLYYLEVIDNIHNLDAQILKSRYDFGTHVIFGFHAVLFSLLMVATFIDYDHLIIPLPLTVVGTVVGLIGRCSGLDLAYERTTLVFGSTTGSNPVLRFYRSRSGGRRRVAPPGSLPGLATGVAGLRWVRWHPAFVCIMDLEYMDDETHKKPQTSRRVFAQRVGGKTMGLGDADLMMMAGAFIGWQPVLVVLRRHSGLVFGMHSWFAPDEPPPLEVPSPQDEEQSQALTTSFIWTGPRDRHDYSSVLAPDRRTVQPMLFSRSAIIVAVLSCI